MKKRLLSIVLLLAMMLTLCACGAGVFEVRFEPGGGELVSGALLQNVEAGAAAEAPELRRDGYAFDGWSEDFSAVSGNMVVAARWKREEAPAVYEVRFELNGGELVSGSLLQRVEAGGSAEAPEVRREGYAFDGWNEALDDVQGNIVTAAMWRRLYTVLFYADGGEFVSGTGEQLVAEGDMPELPVLRRENYAFAGWDTEPAAVSGDAVYYAQWKAVALSSEQVFKKISPAVVEIQVDDAAGLYTTLGSGFFIDDQGTLVTNYHVIDGAVSGQITLEDGSVCGIDAVLGYDASLDIAVLRAELEGNPWLALAEDGVVTGETIYALGSSEGLTSTFSSGNVSTASRMIDGVRYIQITAPISHGNSGGPLVNAFGEVVGINTMGSNEGQNLNFAIDIRELNKVERSLELSLEEVCAIEYPSGAAGGDEHADDSFYEYTDRAEEEPNNIYLLADPVENGGLIAGELTNGNDLDWFVFKVDRACEVSFIVVPGYHEDMEYLLCGVAKLNENGETKVIDALEPASDDELEYMGGTVKLSEPGSYYLVLMLEDSYPYTDPVYYLVDVTW